MSLSGSRIYLGRAIAGVDLEAVLNGSLKTTFKSGEIKVDLVPIHSDQDTIKGDFAWGGDVPFAGFLRAQGPEDGFLHRLIASGGGDLDLEVQGSGDLSSWEISAKLAIGDTTPLTAKILGTDETISGETKIHTEQIRTLEEFSDYLGGPVDVTFNRSKGVLSGAAVSPHLSTTLSIPVRPQDRSLDLNAISLEQLTATGEIARSLPINFRELVSSGSLSVADEIVRFEGSASVTRAEYSEHRAEKIAVPLKLSYDFNDRRLLAKLRPKVSDFSSRSESVEQMLGRNFSASAELAAQLSDNSVAIRSGLLQAQSGSIGISGKVTPKNLRLTGMFQPDAEFLDYPIEILDTVNFSVGREDTGPITIAADGVFKPIGVEQLKHMPPLNMDAKLSIDEALDIHIERVSASAANIQTNVSGSVIDSRVDLQVSVRGDHADISNAWSVKDLSLIGDVYGSVHNLSAVGTISAVSAQTRQISTTNLHAPFSLLTLEGAPKLTLSAAAITPYGHTALSGTATLDQNRWKIQSATASLENFRIQGDISGEGTELSALKGNLKFEGDLPEALPATSLSGKALINDSEIALTARAGEVSLGNFMLSEISMTASGTPNAGFAELSTFGHYELAGEHHALKARMPINWRDAFSSGDVGLLADFGNEKFETRSPILLSLHDGNYRASGEIHGLGGSLRSKLHLNAAAPQIELDLTGIQAKSLARWLGRPPLSGEISGDIILITNAGWLNGRGKLLGKEIGQPGLESPKANIDLGFELEQEELKLRADILSIEDALVVNATAALPVEKTDNALILQPDFARPISGRASGRGQLAAIWSLIGYPEIRLDGLYEVNSELSGTLNAPEYSGSLTISNGEFEGETTGLAFNNIELSSNFSSNEFTVSKLSADGINGGFINGQGRYIFDGSGAVKMTLNTLDAFRREGLSAVLSGDLSFVRGADGARLAGTVVVDRADYNLSKLPSTSLTTVDVRFASDQDTNEESTEGLPIDLGILVTAPRRIFVSGSGVKSEWSLDLGVRGQVLAPDVTGTATIERGEVDFLGREFEFLDSSIVFSGNATNPKLNIHAERDAGDLIARISVTGNATEPSFELFSEPSLPNDEILSRVLFGRSPSELSTFQTAQLGLSVARIAGGKSPLDIVGPIEDVLKIDRLDFNLDENGQATVGAGRYLADDVYLEVRSDTSGRPGVSVEWTPERNLEIVGEVDSNASPKIAVRWKRDFDRNRPQESPSETQIFKDEPDLNDETSAISD